MYSDRHVVISDAFNVLVCVASLLSTILIHAGLQCTIIHSFVGSLTRFVDCCHTYMYRQHCWVTIHQCHPSLVTDKLFCEWMIRSLWSDFWAEKFYLSWCVASNRGCRISRSLNMVVCYYSKNCCTNFILLGLGLLPAQLQVTSGIAHFWLVFKIWFMKTKIDSKQRFETRKTRVGVLLCLGFRYKPNKCMYVCTYVCSLFAHKTRDLTIRLIANEPDSKARTSAKSCP